MIEIKNKLIYLKFETIGQIRLIWQIRKNVRKLGNIEILGREISFSPIYPDWRVYFYYLIKIFASFVENNTAMTTGKLK